MSSAEQSPLWVPLRVPVVAAEKAARATAAAICAAYGAIAVLQALLFEVRGPLLLAAVGTASLLIAVAVHWRIRASEDPRQRLLVPAFLLLALIDAVAIAAVGSGQAIDASWLVLLLLAGGSLLISPLHFAAWATLVAASFAVAVALQGLTPQWIMLGALLLVALLCTVLIRRLRNLLIDRLHGLLSEAESRAHQAESLVDEGAQALSETNALLRREQDGRSRAATVNRRLRAALDQAGEGIVMGSATGEVLYGNRVFFEMMRRDPAEVRHVSELSEGIGDDALLREVAGELEQGRTWSGRYSTLHSDGRLYYRDATVAPLEGDEGSIVGFVGVVRDVTHEVELEASLRRSQRLESVGRLAGGVAHDFNNLLTVVLGYAESLIAGLDEESEERADAEAIQKAALSAAELTRQLLAIGRKQMLQPRTVDLNQCVRSTVHLLGRIVGEDVELRCDLAEGLWPVHVDPAQMEQVLSNLATTARYALPEGGTISIATRNRPAGVEEGSARPPVEGDQVCLVLHDTGVGIEQDLIDRVFEPFFTTKAPGAGNGLGLAQVDGIVQQSGGRVALDSQPGVGTRVTIELPARARSGAESAGAEAGDGAAPGISRGRVLVVEDEQGVRDLVTRLLESEGYEVYSACDGREGLEVVEQRGGDLDLILADVVMPRMGGAAMVRELEGRCSVPVVFMTGYAGDRGGELPDRPLIQKPFLPRALLDLVRRTVGSGSAAPN